MAKKKVVPAVETPEVVGTETTQIVSTSVSNKRIDGKGVAEFICSVTEGTFEPVKGYLGGFKDYEIVKDQMIVRYFSASRIPQGSYNVGKVTVEITN